MSDETSEDPQAQQETAGTRVLPVQPGPPRPKDARTVSAAPSGAADAEATAVRTSLWGKKPDAPTEAVAVGPRTTTRPGAPGAGRDQPPPAGADKPEARQAGPAPGAKPGAPRPTARPATAAEPVPAPGAPRRVRLAVSRVDPWSMMKLAFLLSIAAGIGVVVATAVVWNVLNSLQVFSTVNTLIADIAGTESFINILEYVKFSRVMSISVVVAVVDVVLLTALATVGALLYNVVAALVGGLHVTLTDE